MPEERVYLALGGNLGDRESYIDQALQSLRTISTETLVTSSLYETTAIGPGIQDNHLNLCVSLTTSMPPLDLLQFCKGVEKQLGRIHREKWGPREIDIDILLYGDQTIHFPELTIPHPELHKRFFVTIPLAEINPHLEIPKQNKTVLEFARHFKTLNEMYSITKLSPLPHHEVA